ncbi:1-aminocyclopropane-1-carboxylate oxidase 4-like [Neltuma alba]|uniref:1-aminocyclopropane-1-carboxylate oxidase 4-like n=1 Tax=Neltuma alba TaxID=207710 RepID=UPI0010A3D615|nr:1-aminocyclopropane-1-carboxylate oxidase 4-like [Prosopis alba]
MAVTPQSIPDIPIDFRAPPPSPIASGRRSSFANDDVLTEFLETSLRVPDLILPDKIFPKQNCLETPPKVDFRSLCSDHEDYVASSSDVVSDSMARIGCFQLVNHGVPRELMASSREVAQAIFQVPPEKRATVTRSPPEKPWGFEEYHSEEDGSELSEEFVWCRDHDLKLKMEGISPVGYSKFSKEMEALMSSIEKVAEKILPVMLKNFPGKLLAPSGGSDHQGHEFGTLCCVYKHSQDSMADGWANSLKYDVIRMLIRGSDYSHALCLHVCDGCSEFHVYSKKGWLSFCPEQGALIITAGDQIQVASGGLCKQVIGRPILKGEKDDDGISMAFLYSPPNDTTTSETKKEATISLGQQALLAMILILVYQFLIFVYKKF